MQIEKSKVPNEINNPSGRATRPRRAGRPPRGLGLPEALVSLAIGSTLLVALAASFAASAKVSTNNDKFFTAVQGGRVALKQILTELRRCDQVAVTSTTLDVTRPSDSTLKDSRSTYETTRTFTFDSANKQITLVIHYNNGTTAWDSPAYVLARNVTADSGGPFTYDSYSGSYASRVAVTIICVVGNDQIRLTGSAAVRRNSAYSS